jgi:hypothetical protein
MEIRLAVSLVWLAIGSVLPAFAQQKDTVDPQIAQQIGALAAKFDEAYNRHDSTAVAAFYTEDAVKVTPHGNIFRSTGHRKRPCKKRLSAIPSQRPCP